MNLKYAVLLIVFLLSGAAIFADETQSELPKNAIAIDVGPTLTYLFLSGIMAITDTHVFSIGVGAQYERQITEKISIEGRLGYGVLNSFGYDSKWNMFSFSSEIAGRYYLLSTYFLGLSLGYANVFSDIANEKTAAHFFRLGGKMGWRIDFKEPGGFILEPAIAYYVGIGPNPSYDYDDALSYLNSMLGFLNYNIGRMLFIDGFRLSLCLGYRF